MLTQAVLTQETTTGKLPQWDPENPKNKEVLRRRGLDDDEEEDDEPVYQPPPQRQPDPEPVSGATSVTLSCLLLHSNSILRSDGR